MKAFIFKLFIFIALNCLIIWACSLFYKPAINLASDYMAAIIDKHKRLKELNGNRLLLVGGSNLVFGIDSRKLEKDLNKKVVNLGLDAGLGFEFIMNEAIDVVRRNDIVLLSIEYPLYDADPDLELIYHTRCIYPEVRKYYQFNLLEQAFVTVIKFRKCLSSQKPRIDPVYNRQLFDEYGDQTGHLGKSPRKYLMNSEPLQKIKVNYNILKKLILRCQSVGAHLYFSYPTCASSFFNNNKLYILELENQLQGRLKKVEFVGKPSTFSFGDSLYYDSVYHLTARGRDLRTAVLSELLKQKLSNSEDSMMK